MIVSALVLAAAIPAAEQSAVYRAANAIRRGGKWLLCADEPRPEGVSVDHYGDSNGDGRPEALLSEGGTYCYGATGAGYAFVSKKADGAWQLLSRGAGMVTLLGTRGTSGFPDLSIGGPGFCFPVERWNGRAYTLHRHEYDGKACRPDR